MYSRWIWWPAVRCMHTLQCYQAYSLPSYVPAAFSAAGADLSKLLYSWARLDWHPEQKLLADVATSFLAAASAEATAANSSASDASAHWLAAGLWGLARLGEPFNGPVLTLLQQQWRALLPFWSKQQVADVAWALVAAADESTAAEALEQQQQPVDAEQLSPMVLGLAERLADRLLHQQQQGARWVPAVGWPEVLLLKMRPCRHQRQRLRLHLMVQTLLQELLRALLLLGACCRLWRLLVWMSTRPQTAGLAGWWRC